MVTGISSSPLGGQGILIAMHEPPERCSVSLLWPGVALYLVALEELSSAATTARSTIRASSLRQC